MVVRLDFRAVKNICLNKSKYSFFIEIEKPELSFWISNTHDSSSESISDHEIQKTVPLNDESLNFIISSPLQKSRVSKISCGIF